MKRFLLLFSPYRISLRFRSCVLSVEMVVEVMRNCFGCKEENARDWN
jgi:hypothetical protein